MTPPRRLNEMRFCDCGHGQGAHRQGRGPCSGGRRFGGAWLACECSVFTVDPDYDGVTDEGSTSGSSTGDGGSGGDGSTGDGSTGDGGSGGGDTPGFA